MSSIDQIDKAHTLWIDSLLANFQAHLEAIISSAKAKLQARLHEALSLADDGTVLRTAANAQVIRQLDQWFMQEMQKCGYGHLLQEFTHQFPGQFKFFQQTLEMLSDQSGVPLSVDWTPTDLKAFSAFGLNAQETLMAAMENVANVAKNRILFSFAGLKFSDLVVTLAHSLDVGVPQAVSMAETATATFYRTLAAQGYQKIERNFPGKEIRYRYYGPQDKLTRPWCSRMMSESAGGKSWTKAELDAMDNGSSLGKPVLQVGGGWRCRHQFLLVVPEKTGRPAS